MYHQYYFLASHGNSQSEDYSLSPNQIQNEIASKSLKEIQKKFKKEIVTIICKCKIFYVAEEYHQKYLKKNPGYIKTCKIPTAI